MIADFAREERLAPGGGFRAVVVVFGHRRDRCITLWIASLSLSLVSNPVVVGDCQTYNYRMKQLTLPVIVESDADGYFVSCPALQGCCSQGDTYEEAIENIKDAIRLHIEDHLASGEEVPEHVSVSLSTVEVAI